jgi:hypothetical protein
VLSLHIPRRGQPVHPHPRSARQRLHHEPRLR